MPEYHDISTILEAMNDGYAGTLERLLAGDKGELLVIKSTEELKKLEEEIKIELFDNFIEVNPPKNKFFEQKISTPVVIDGEKKSLVVKYFVELSTFAPFFGSMEIKPFIQA
jgi:hypothetical protein